MIRLESLVPEHRPVLRTAARYLVTIGVAVVVVLAADALDESLEGVRFAMPIAITALLALALGAGPGTVAALLVGLGTWYFVQPPRGSFLLDERDVPRLLAYFVASACVLFAIGLLDRTRRRLATKAEQLRALAENSPEVIARFDRELRHVYVNEFGARVYGKSRAEVLGRTSADLGMPADKVAFWRDRFEQVFASGQQQTVDFDFESPNLGRRYFSSLFVPETDPAGRVVSILAITRDVTEARGAEVRLREERDFIAAVLDTAASIVAVLGPDGRFLRCNRACEEASGYTAAELTGKSYGEMVPAEEREAVDRTFRELASGAAVPNHHENHWVRKDGGLRRIAWANTVVAGEDGTMRFVVATGVDVTERARAEEDLRRAAEVLELGDANLEVDSDWRIVRMNAQMERLSAKPRQAAIGRSFWEVWPEAADPASAYWREYRRCMRDRVPVQFEEYFRPLGLWTAVTAYPIATGGLAIFSRDIGARKRAGEALRESEAKFRSIFEQGAIGLGRVAFDDARWLDVNDAFCRMLGRSRDEMLRTPWPDMTHPEDLDLDLMSFRKMAAGDLASYTVEKRFLHADGHPVWAKLTLSLVRDANGRPAYEIAFIEDIGDRKRAQAELEEADRRKNEFLAMLSHELRNPLAPIKNSLFVLRHALPGGPQALRARDVIDRQVVQLTRLVDDLLDVTRITRGKIRLQKERLDVCALVQRTAEDHRSIFGGAGVQLEVGGCGGPLHAEGDPARLAQIVGNLLTNAAKFTPPGGHVRVAVERDGGVALIRVRDDGAGIPPGLEKRLFEPFVQADATLDRSKGGLGLGLALVKGLAELHGGAVSARSDGPGRGAEFVVRLPAEPAARPEVQLAYGESPGCGSKTLRVLLIEDNADAASSLKEALEFGGHQVEIANTGFEGLAKAPAFSPDVVLCDIGLPGIDGFEVARRMRADPAVEAPLVALSGYAGPDDLERSRAAGFVRHLAKPPDLDVLERTLCDAWSSSRHGDRPTA